MKKIKWARRFDFSVLSTWLWLSLMLAIISFLWFGMDFRGYYAAARVLMTQGNPYDYGLVSQALLEITGEMGNNPHYYPPWFAWLFLLLAALPFQLARAVWITFNLIIWNIGLWQVGKIIGWPALGWQRYSLFALTTFSVAWITWRNEQASILVFILLIVLILLIRNQSWIWAGVCFVLLFF